MGSPKHAAAALVALLAVGVAGCKAVEPAPEDLDGLFGWFWLHYEDASDAELREALTSFGAAADVDAIDAVTDGSLSDFSREDMDVVSMREDADPAELVGMYLTNVLPCATDRTEEIVISLDQMTLYDGAYDSYERTYTSDEGAYRDRDTATLSWSSDIGAELLSTPYTETVLGSIRRVEPSDNDDPLGTLLLARYWMPAEAVFSNDDYFFTQDYQLELYFERADGVLVHLYGLWRNMGFGDLSTEDEGISRLVLNGLADWDEQTATLCEERR